MSKWLSAPLASAIQCRKEFVSINDLSAYKRCRVQLHAQGIVLRDTVPGAEIKTKKQQVCKAGDFLVAEIDAKVGGFGIVPEELDQAIVSSHYFLFGIDQTKLDRRFLDFYIRTPAFRDQVAAQGSTNYAAIRPNDVLGYKIPLPPLPEQRRIVARIESLAAEIQEARGLRAVTAKETEAILASGRRALIGDPPASDWIPLSRHVAEIENGKSPATDGRPATRDEWGVLKVGAVSFGLFDEGENKALPLSYMPPPNLEVRVGDFLMSRANTRELVGACAYVRKTRSKLMLSDKTFRFVFRKPQAVVPEYLEHLLKSPPLRDQIERQASGTSPTMKNISKEKVLALQIPNHTIEEQRRIVTYLDGLQAKVEALKKLQAETTAELAALLPSILDKAFKGEL
ncbi:MAG: hypothetical protein A4E19_16455 [Nitrospira sp. SG-bin1]|nr:MAG: hypothetical protein A4E19_16455 [Nitrospira sp. SG-bin1]